MAGCATAVERSREQIVVGYTAAAGPGHDQTATRLRSGQSLVPVEPAVLGVRVQFPEHAPGRQVVDLCPVWCRP